MKRTVPLLLVLLLTIFITNPIKVFSQTKAQKEEIIKKTNIEELKKIDKKYKEKFKEEKEKALKLAAEKSWVVREEKDGKLIELMKVSKEGNPIYFTTFNMYAAISTRANTLHNGGLLGLNLEGQGMTAHVWDGGLARTTHQEYDGTGGTDRFSIGDESTALHYHSAHVTGTIMASGVQEAAKGMAPQAYAVGFDWNNDMGEAVEAAANGMLLSNHSYGWRASDIPDWYFGAYLSDSRDWDVIMYNAPYYLMCVAAGNDGDDNTSNGAPLDGDTYYDKLSSHATSKNNLVVANAQDIGIDADGNLVSININSSSSEGPTDDYRIKPDIAGKGTNLYSSAESSNSAYISLTGTSMATPNVTGTLLLLQQHYNNLNSTFMRAATLKGLALHTADDAGTPGPDAVFGWGLLNAKKAAQLISSRHNGSIISELNLSQGQTYNMDVYATGTEDLVVSISWTDPPGPANEGTPNLTTPVLVNDLDVRVYQGANTYYPFKLTSLTTNSNGDNIVDPFEKIIISSPTPGVIYKITVSHKGTLASSQNYSLIVSGIDGNSPNSFTSVSNDPNQIDLNWNKNSENNDVLLAYSLDGTFGNPVNQSSYNVGNSIPDGGTVLYNGSETSYNHSALAENTHYYYKMWSILPSGDYSAGVYTDEVTIKSTSTNYPTSFTAGIPFTTNIPLSWVDATGSVIPDGYLIKASSISFEDIVTPTNGFPETNSRLTKNIAAGIQTVTFDSLVGVTTYYFKIFPYTNSGSNIYYKTDGAVPEATAQTEVDPCAGITLPYSENFDSGDNCWNGITGSDDWINVTPTTPAGDHTGGGTCFVTNGNNDYNTNSVYNLTSPTISLNGFANCELTFWIYMNSELQSDGEFWDGGYIECFDGTKWTKIETSLPYDGPLSSGNPLAGELGWSPTAIRDWTLVTADISAFDENPDFRIRFRFGSDGAAVAPGWAIDDINITGSATCTPPADQATNFAASNETFNSIDISWNRGTPSGGDNVLVVAREISAEHTDPTKGESYIANSTFGLGDEIGTGNFVVYNGTGTNISVTNLNNVTTYVFSVYEYSSTESCYNLIELIGTGTTAPKTEPSSHVSDFATGIVSSSEIPLTWVDATSGVEPDGYLIFVNTTGIFSNPTNSIPVYDDIDLTDGSGAVSVEQGIQAYTFTGLNFSTHYYFKIYPYTNNGDLILYKTDGEVPTTDATTLIDPCSIPISDLTDYTETFDIPETLDCWEIIDNQGNDQVWEFGNISGVTFGDGNYAFLNSDGFGMSDSQNSDLVTPIFDFTSYEDVTISFTHYYRHNSGSSATFYYKINNGDWKKIQQWVATTDNPTNFNQVINALDGQSQVRFKFNYTGSWDYYWLVDDFSVSGTTVCTPPTNQATNFISTAQTENSLTISWTRGSPAGGDEVLVLARKSGAVNSIPENGETYTSNTEFGNGSLIGADNYVVYTGTGTSVTVENLSGSTTYYFEIYEYTNSTKCYLVPGLTGSATTTAKPEPTNHVSSFATGNVSSSEITLTWTDASGGIEPDGYLIKVNTTGTFADPTDTNPISDDLVFGDGSGAINIPQGTQIFTLTGLINSTQYFFKIYPYTNSGALINYKINEYPPEVNETTLSDPCVINLSNESYTEGFENVTTPNLPECTSIENTNGDAYQWVTATTDPRPGGTKHLSIRWNSAAAMDDWFFSQPLLLDAGYEYNVSFWYRAESSSYVEKLEVMWGTSNSSASMTLGQIFDNSNITSTTYIQGQAIITPTSNGVYYIGWHGYSLADKYYLYIDDISVTKGEAVNIAPSVENPIADITENEGFVSTGIDLTNVFSDADSDELTFSAVAENETIVTVNIVGNTLTVTEVGIGTTNITVTADDGNGGTVDDVFSFTVNENSNNAPVVENTIPDETENEGFVSTDIDLTNVFADDDDDELSFSAISDDETIVTVGVTGSTLTVTEVGTGTTSITVTADDGKGGTADDTFNFTVNAVPEVENPIADITEQEGFTSTGIDLTNVFADDDDDELSFSAISDDETIVTVGVTGSTLTVTEVGTGTTSITVTADDGKGGTADDTFNFCVNAFGNNIPNVENPIVDIVNNEGFISINIDLTNVFADTDDDALTYSAISENEEIVAVSIVGSTLSISEVGIGTTTITVTANDGKGGTVSDTFSFTVNAIPYVANSILNITENEGFVSVTINLLNIFTDNDGDVLTYSAISENESIITVEVVEHTLFLTETSVGTASITVTANDGKGGTTSEVFNFTVNAIPTVENPVADIALEEGFSTTDIDLTNVFTDADGDVLSYSAVSEDELVVTVSVAGSTLTVTEVGIGATSITVTANDGNGGTVNDVFNFTVSEIPNSAPTVANPITDIVLEEGFGTTNVDLTNVFADTDGDVLTYTAVSENETIVTVSIVGNALSVTEVSIGTSEITVTASDGNGGTVNESFSFTVSEIPNSAPTVANPIADISLEEGFNSTDIDLTNVFTDADGDVLSYSAVSENELVVTVSVAGNTLTVTEVGNGATSITVTANDSNGGTVNDVFSFTVNEIPNSAPTVANPITDIVLEEGFGTTDVDLTNVFADADGDVLSYSAASENELVVTVSVAGNTLTVTEVGIGAASITVTANDGNGGTVSDSFSFTLNTGTYIEPLCNFNMNIYPNPVNDILNIQLISISDNEINFEVFDIKGRKVLSRKFDKDSLNRLIQINVSDFSSGVYLIQLRSDKFTETIRFIKE